MKTIMAHTPGPWQEMVGYTSDRQPFIYIRAGNRSVASVTLEERDSQFQTEHTEANARLIAAAPDMLKTLTHILAMHDSGNNGAYRGEAILSESAAMEIRAAIAKAEGR